MGVVIFSVIFTTALAVGVGLLAAITVLRSWYAVIGYRLPLGDLGLVGLAVLGVVGSILHVLLPLGGLSTLLVCAAAATGYWLGLARRATLFEQHSTMWSLAPTGAALVFCVSAIIQQDGVSQYDAGLYHLQAILLNAEYPIIPGVANLHVRFGYNSLWHVILAMLQVPLLGLNGSLAANGAITVLFGLAITQRVVEGPCSITHTSSRIFGLAVLIAVICWPETAGIGSPSTDWPATLLVIYVFFLATLLGINQSDSAGPAGTASAYVMLTVAAALSLTLKPTHAPIVLLAFLLLPHVWSKIDRKVMVALGLPLTIIGIWLLRGLFLSGCAAYPLSWTCVEDLPWTIPPAILNDDLAWIKSWARRPGFSPDDVLRDWGWMSEWLVKNWRNGLFPGIALILAASLPMLILRGLYGSKLVTAYEELPAESRAIMLSSVLVAALGIVWWYLTAPTWRFGLGFLVALPMLLLSLAVPVPRSVAWTDDAVRRAWVGVFVVVSLLRGGIGLHLGDSNVAWPVLPDPQVSPRLAADGSRYYVPVVGDQCWAAPRPCTPRASPDLQFEQIGIWTMIRSSGESQVSKPSP